MSYWLLYASLFYLHFFFFYCSKVVACDLFSVLVRITVVDFRYFILVKGPNYCLVMWTHHLTCVSCCQKTQQNKMHEDCKYLSKIKFKKKQKQNIEGFQKGSLWRESHTHTLGLVVSIFGRRVGMRLKNEPLTLRGFQGSKGSTKNRF